MVVQKRLVVMTSNQEISRNFLNRVFIQMMKFGYVCVIVYENRSGNQYLSIPISCIRAVLIAFLDWMKRCESKTRQAAQTSMETAQTMLVETEAEAAVQR
ncbi:unnamed protein product [Gongylonema pulchrum]|uniref:Uncharacterized protein n=1 Tax=Gongylonema pulchrum TaxID=637853 RepID=A0A3P6S6D6_9BILA|nr:unnamed protein product [Gongylonema pulchrum]